MTNPPSVAPSEPTVPVALKLLHVAWLSIAIGCVLEVLLLVVEAALGKDATTNRFMADLAQKVSWSALICMGLAVGTAAAKAARQAVMGLMGFLTAPIAFMVARVLHKSVAHALGVPTVASAMMIAVSLKAVEYAIFGYLIGRLARRDEMNLRLYFKVGLALGGIFAALNVALMFWQAAATPAPADWVARALNELLFPIGCAFVLFVAEYMGRRASLNG